MGKGRPTLYDESYNIQVFKLCLLGATDKSLADFFGIAESTLNKWKIDYPDFMESIRAGKDEADAKVAESLYNRALGYSHPDTKFATHEGKITDSKEYTKHYPPDPTSGIFWLKNRQKDTWRDKHDHEHSGKIELESLTDEQLDARIRALSNE